MKVSKCKQSVISLWANFECKAAIFDFELVVGEKTFTFKMQKSWEPCYVWNWLKLWRQIKLHLQLIQIIRKMSDNVVSHIFCTIINYLSWDPSNEILAPV